MENQTAEVLVLGGGPGGYTAAFRAADLGKRVVLVDREPALGGVCLNVGCIPSKALLHAAKVIAETKEMSENGITFGAPAIDLDKLRAWKQGVVGRLTGGLAGLAKQRKVTTIRGYGRFTSPHQLQVELAEGGTITVSFEQAIIAAGSQALTLPFIPASDPRVIDSTGALELREIPGRLLVIGGGIIGLEMACVYHELGAKITVVELLEQLIPGADKDLISPLTKRITRQYENIYVTTKGLPVGRQRPLTHPRPVRRADQGAVRRRQRPDHRLRHHRAERGRPHRRGGAGHRDGRRRRRHRPDHPSPPHAVRDRRPGRRGVRGHDHRPVPAQTVAQLGA